MAGLPPGRGKALVEAVKSARADNAVESEVKSIIIFWYGSTSESLRCRYGVPEILVGVVCKRRT